MNKQYDFDQLLGTYFSGKLTNAEKQAVDKWKEGSDENRIIFNNAEKVWQSLDLLQEMRSYNTAGALSKVHEKTIQASENIRKGFLFYWQRIAAILLLPILLISGFYLLQELKSSGDDIVWQTITTPPGIKSKAQLPDGTVVWLNSGSSLQYPSSFTRNERAVKLIGEAFFDVAKDEKHPFLVDLGRIGIEVLGTKFNVTNYDQEKRTEVVLTSGKVQLYGMQKNRKQLITEMLPGQHAVYQKSEHAISMLEYVDPEKYTSWIEGRLVFRDDAMNEVVRRLGRWFNVEIEMADPEIGRYVYTATFLDETMEQILELLKKTAPIEYTIIPSKRLNDGSFDKQKIILNKK